MRLLFLNLLSTLFANAQKVAFLRITILLLLTLQTFTFAFSQKDIQFIGGQIAEYDHPVKTNGSNYIGYYRTSRYSNAGRIILNPAAKTFTIKWRNGNDWICRFTNIETYKEHDALLGDVVKTIYKGSWVDDNRQAMLMTTKTQSNLCEITLKSGRVNDKAYKISTWQKIYTFMTNGVCFYSTPSSKKDVEDIDAANERHYFNIPIKTGISNDMHYKLTNISEITFVTNFLEFKNYNGTSGIDTTEYQIIIKGLKVEIKSPYQNGFMYESYLIDHDDIDPNEQVVILYLKDEDAVKKNSFLNPPKVKFQLKINWTSRTGYYIELSSMSNDYYRIFQNHVIIKKIINK